MLDPDFEHSILAVNKAHKLAGIDHEIYEKYNFALDQMLTYFYINGSNQGFINCDITFFIQNKINWRQIYTDKFVKCDASDPGCVGLIHGQGYKDQYFDYSLVCLEYQHLDTFDQMRNIINKHSINVYKLKPPTMMYLAGMVNWQKTPKKFNECFYKFKKTLNFFQNLS